MKTILIATDFSRGATNAMNYALDLAVNEGAGILLFHASKPGRKNSAEEKLMAIQNEILNAKKLACERILREGDPGKLIVEIIQERQPDITVLGMKGEGSALERLIGSTTRNVIELAKCPVMAIPENAVFSPITNITFATDFHDSDINAITTLVEIAKPFHAEITLLHISEERKNGQSEKTSMENLKKKIEEKTAYSHVSSQILPGKNRQKELEEFSRKNSTDLLVVSTHHRNTIDKIFGKSITKGLTFHSSIPLLVFHHKQKPLIFIFGLAIMK